MTRTMTAAATTARAMKKLGYENREIRKRMRQMGATSTHIEQIMGEMETDIEKAPLMKAKPKNEVKLEGYSI